MFPDFKDLIELLNKHKAKYLVVGGYAVGWHAQPRATKDLDILVQPAPKNAVAVFRALQEFGAPLQTRVAMDNKSAPLTRKLEALDFQDRGTWYSMGVPPVAIDILPEIPGVAFDRAWKNRTTYVVDKNSGLTAHVISREDLIAAKLAAGRPRDLADVAELRRAAAVDPPEVSPTGKAKNARKRT